MGAFGIKPAIVVKPINLGQEWTGEERVPCDCSACEQLRQVTQVQRAAAAFGYVIVWLLSSGIAITVLLMLVWVIVLLWRQL